MHVNWSLTGSSQGSQGTAGGGGGAAGPCHDGTSLKIIKVQFNSLLTWQDKQLVESRIDVLEQSLAEVRQRATDSERQACDVMIVSRDVMILLCLCSFPFQRARVRAGWRT